MPRPLQEITDAWGRWMVTQHTGGKLRYTESTNYANQSSLAQYHEHEVTIGPYGQYLRYDYDKLISKEGPAAWAPVTTELVNDTGLKQTLTYQESMETKQTATWTVTENLQIGVPVLCATDLPYISPKRPDLNVKIELSTLSVQTKPGVQPWRVLQPIECGPHTRTDARMFVETREYELPWTGETFLTGEVAIWFDKKVSLWPGSGEHHLYFIAIESVIDDCQRYGLVDVTGYFSSYQCVLAFSKGIFTGSQGLRSKVDLLTYPAIAQADPAQGRVPANSYQLLIANDGGFATLSAAD